MELKLDSKQLKRLYLKIVLLKREEYFRGNEDGLGDTKIAVVRDVKMIAQARRQT